MPQIAVLGAGLAGLAAAQALRAAGLEAVLYEKNTYVGGHAASHVIDGFIFDEGPHVSFTKDPAIQVLFAATVEDAYIEQEATLTNYYQGYWVKHPVQTNLHGLPIPLVEQAIIDFVRSQYEDEFPLETYADWCYRQFGRTMSEELLFRYTRKYWTTEAGNMSLDWVGPRVYPPALEEVIRGALGPATEEHHYISRFRYPKHGGFAAYVQSVARSQEVRFGHDVVEIDVRHKRLSFANGNTTDYEALISSLPLPELIRLIKDAPAHVAEAAGRLTCTSLLLANLGVVGTEPIDAHWFYVYDEDIIFARGNFPHRLSPSNAPEGCWSMQLEVYHSKYRPLPCEDVLSRVIDDARRMGLLRPDDRILVAREQRIPYANVLFDLDRKPNLAVVRQYLDEQGIICCGRYGEWAYYWTDDSILSGWRAAERTLDVYNASEGVAL